MVAKTPISALFKLAPQEAVEYLQGRDQLAQTFSWQDMWHEEHARMFTVSRLTNLDILQSIQDGITRSVNGDLSRRDWTKNAEQLLRDAGWWGRKEVLDPATGEMVTTIFDSARLKLIFDTNTRMAYSAGLWQRIWRNKKTHPYIRYITKRDERVRLSHRAWDNLTLPVEHPFWQTHFPPNGWRCRCRAMSISQAEYDKGMSPLGETLNKTAPEVGTRDWVNKRTGVIESVPLGIDPGFAYNPGLAARQANLAEFEAQKLAQASPALAAAYRAADNAAMKTRNYLTRVGVAEFYERAINNRALKAKRPIGRLVSAGAISATLGREADIDEIVLQSSYLVHIHDYHAEGGIRNDAHPFMPEDLLLAVDVINNDANPVYSGKKSHTGNPLLKFSMVIDGITYKVIGEIRVGRKNRNVAVFNLYKR